MLERFFIFLHFYLYSFCNGSTLYQHLHIYGEKFLPPKCVNIARQVSQVRHLTLRILCIYNYCDLLVVTIGHELLAQQGDCASELVDKEYFLVQGGCYCL